MEDRFETTFAVQVPVEQVWRSIEDRRPEAATGSAEEDAKRWWLPGFEASAVELEVEPGRRLRVRKDTQPCEGTEVVVTLEATDTGTRVTVVQSGFGAWFEAALDSLEIGWSQIVADLVLYLERGIIAARHLLPWAGFGCSVREVTTGLEVVDIYPGGFAEQAGLEAGDLLLTIGNAPVFTLRDFQSLMRVFRSGEKVEATWVRDRSRLSASAVL